MSEDKNRSIATCRASKVLNIICFCIIKLPGIRILQCKSMCFICIRIPGAYILRFCELLTYTEFIWVRNCFVNAFAPVNGNGYSRRRSRFGVITSGKYFICKAICSFLDRLCASGFIINICINEISVLIGMTVKLVRLCRGKLIFRAGFSRFPYI